jgi:glycosyltransferase involved in cell wall biosynthesis
MSISLADLHGKRIGIDYSPAFEQTAGIGRYVRELIGATAQLERGADYRLLVTGSHANALPAPLASNFHWSPTRLSTRRLWQAWLRPWIPLPVELFTGEIDLFHATNFVLPKLHSKTRALLTVHDVSYVRVPEVAGTGIKPFLDAIVPRGIARADHIIADSLATKHDIIDIYGTPADKITVLLSAAEDRFQPVTDPHKLHAVRQKYAIPDRPYVFSVGTVQPRKNFGRLIEALAIVRSHGHDIGVVIAGGRGWKEDPIYATVTQTSMTDYVRFIGFADDEDLPALYSGAEQMVLPSLYEGFGFPVLEAMGCRTPVITSNVSSLPEVAGDAAILVTPTDVEAIAHAIEHLLTHREDRQALIEKGVRQAATFTWEKSARHLISLYQQVLQA